MSSNLYHAAKCCSHPSCDDWHVYPVAMARGVSFTELQARVVARTLNALDHMDPTEQEELLFTNRIIDEMEAGQ